jgi:hypothetical protein
MKYVIVDKMDWADECDVYFFDILSQEDYDKYNFLKQTLGHLYGSYYFGTNEGWEDGEFDYLQFVPKPATDEEIAVLEKFKITGEPIIERLINTIECTFDWEGISYISDLWSKEYGEFCQIIDNNKDLFK